MMLVPLTTCCLSLGVDPKTLRLWLKAAQLSCSAHPADARLKCLTLAELEQMAQVHRRPLRSLVPGTAPQPVAVPVDAAASGDPSATPGPEKVHLSHHLDVLQQQVATLQAQVTELALALLAVRSPSSQLPPSAPLASAAAPEAPCLLPGSPAHPSASLTNASASVRPRARSRALPLIQVRTDRSVMTIAPNEGVLPLLPDSAEWFAWLSCIESFSFESPTGRFSATRKFRDGQRIQSWNVHRSLHGRSCTFYLGLTPTLTLARLHEIAAAVHARLTTH